MIYDVSQVLVVTLKAVVEADNSSEAKKIFRNLSSDKIRVEPSRHSLYDIYARKAKGRSRIDKNAEQAILENRK